jgi:myo-inositol-1(or 4)-monophosphatase
MLTPYSRVIKEEEVAPAEAAAPAAEAPAAPAPKKRGPVRIRKDEAGDEAPV